MLSNLTWDKNREHYLRASLRICTDKLNTDTTGSFIGQCSESPGQKCTLSITWLRDYTHLHCKKRLAVFPSPAGMSLHDQTLPGREYLNYSRPGRVWSVASLLGTGKPLTFCYSVCFKGPKQWYGIVMIYCGSGHRNRVHILPKRTAHYHWVGQRQQLGESLHLPNNLPPSYGGHIST